jgi:transposase-like protein
MARPKGGKNRKWTNEERLKYVLMCEEEHIPVRTIVREEGISRGTLREWIRRYRSGGEEALNPEKLHPGNHFSALHTSKSLSENERLILLVEKLQIENERLKKGYTVKGVGADKEFVTTKDLNSK